MLPEGFHWANRHQYDTQATALTLNGRQVAMLLERTDGSWFVRVNAHRGVAGRLVLADCGTLEAGRERLKRWAVRNDGRLRRETTQPVAPLPMSTSAAARAPCTK